MKMIESVADVAVSYVKLKYPDKVIGILYDALETDFIDSFCDLFDISYDKVSDYIFIEFTDTEEGVGFAEQIEIDSQSPFCIVLDRGVTIYESGTNNEIIDLEYKNKISSISSGG